MVTLERCNLSLPIQIQASVIDTRMCAINASAKTKQKIYDVMSNKWGNFFLLHFNTLQTMYIINLSGVYGVYTSLSEKCVHSNAKWPVLEIIQPCFSYDILPFMSTNECSQVLIHVAE